jgi:hypothetical protein
MAFSPHYIHSRLRFFRKFLKERKNGKKDLEHFIGVYRLFGCIATGPGWLRLGLD